MPAGPVRGVPALPGERGLTYEKYMERSSGVDGGCMGPAVPVVCLSIPSAREDLAGVPAPSFPVPVNPAPRCFCLRVWGAVRACTWLSAGSAVEEPARTYISGQRRRDKHHSAAFMQVRGYVEVQAGAGCKTVGSAYVGTNPTPATTCRNGPLAGISRLCGPFLLCPMVCHLVALRAAVSRWSGSGGALLRPRPLTTRRATHRGTGLKRPAWAGRLCFQRSVLAAAASG